MQPADVHQRLERLLAQATGRPRWLIDPDRKKASYDRHHPWTSAHDSASLLLSYIGILADEPQRCVSPARSTASMHVLPLIDKAIEEKIQSKYKPVEVKRKTLTPVLEYAMNREESILAKVCARCAKVLEGAGL